MYEAQRFETYEMTSTGSSTMTKEAKWFILVILIFIFYILSLSLSLSLSYIEIWCHIIRIHLFVNILFKKWHNLAVLFRKCAINTIYAIEGNNNSNSKLTVKNTNNGLISFTGIHRSWSIRANLKRKLA